MKQLYDRKLCVLFARAKQQSVVLHCYPDSTQAAPGPGLPARSGTFLEHAPKPLLWCSTGHPSLIIINSHAHLISYLNS